MKSYIFMAFLALIIFLSLVIGLFDTVTEGYKSVINYNDEKYVVDGSYTEDNGVIKDINGNIVQFQNIKSQKILAKEYISFVEDKVVGRVFKVKGYYNDSNGFEFNYKDNDGIVIGNIIESKRIANNPTITKDGTELEIVDSYYHVSFIKVTGKDEVFPVKWYYNSTDTDYTNNGSTIKKGENVLEIVNINLSKTAKTTLYNENIKYAMNDNSGESFQLPREPIANRYSSNTDDADGDGQYKIVDGKVVKNNDWDADTAFPDYNDSAKLVAEKNANEKAKNQKMYVTF